MEQPLQYNILKAYKNIIFDLDETLYPENSYLKPVFLAIAKSVAIDNEEKINQYFDFLDTTFEKEGRKNLYNHFIEQFGLSNQNIEQFLQIQRNIILEKELTLFSYVKLLFDSLTKENKKIFILTNGNVTQQKNKVKSINWQGLDLNIHFVYANEYAPKPASDVFFYYLKPKFEINPSETIMLGDGQSDFDFCKKLGIDFIYIQKTGWIK